MRSISATTVYNSSSAKDVATLKADIYMEGTLDIAGAGGISTGAMLIPQDRVFTIRNTGTGTGNVILSNDRYFHVGNNSQFIIATNVSGGGNQLVKAGPGALILTAPSSNTLGRDGHQRRICASAARRRPAGKCVLAVSRRNL